MRILFLHGWTSVTGGVKPTFLKDHGHTVFNPKLPEEAVQIAQDEFDEHKPHVVVGSSWGGAVAMNIKSGDARLFLLCPTWNQWGSARKAKPGTLSGIHGPTTGSFSATPRNWSHQRAASVGFDRGRKGVTHWPTRSRWKKLLKESDPS